MDAVGYYSDQTRSDVRIDTAMAAAEYEQRAVNSHHAAMLVAIHGVLEEARFSPEVFVGDHASRFSREHVEFADRAAIACLWCGWRWPKIRSGRTNSRPSRCWGAPRCAGSA